jgi:sucrose-6-phosphate hydrolase SacC (GH32 family)
MSLNDLVVRTNQSAAPMYYKGYYHLFYQWNPYDRVWGNISWGHSVSPDLIHWQYLEPSIRADEWYDLQGAWSGYATTVEGRPVVLYTSGRGDFGPDANQSISMALPVDPSDPLLRNWKKYDSNPILYSPPGFSSQAFRDPTTAWHDEDAVSLWRLVVPSMIQNADKTRDGVGLMYTSPDFYHWQLEETYLHRVHKTGTWECLDLYPIVAENELAPGGKALDPEIYHDGLRYVLKAGMDETRIDYYAIGTYSTKTHTFTPDDLSMDVGFGHCYDYGWFYASKTFYDVSTRRRILWGFVHEADSEEDDRFKGWSSLQVCRCRKFYHPKDI